MNSHTGRRFRSLYRDLPAHVRRQTQTAYEQFSRDPFHPSLHFKEIDKKHHIWSARINDDYRVLGIRHDDEIDWFWIGSHSDYDKLISQLK